MGQADKVAEFYKPGRDFVMLLQVRQSLIQCQQAVGRFLAHTEDFVKLDTTRLSAMLDGGFAASIFDHNAAHGLGRGGKEVASAFPDLFLTVVADQAQIRLMHEPVA